ncbi:Polysaccharide deacetylase [Microvirga guangxiensis]|uniref:Chitooligosaccharide deacetylase n=1 Tax=Microvirga guangxiensis TaxID=549386 RepID=A0A1G5H0A3_9HYPH|nr:Polysaccharide deacetylase [Microvirga guangxiensis]
MSLIPSESMRPHQENVIGSTQLQFDQGSQPRLRVVTHTAKSILVRFGIVGLARQWPSSQRQATILRYHSVSSAGDYRSPTISVHPEMFRRQMEFLSRHYDVLTLDELVSGLETGSLPPKAVAITFDDGYKDNATEALPILARYNLPATFFVTSDAVLGKSAFWTGWLHRAVSSASEETLRKASDSLIGGMSSVLSREKIYAALASQVDHAHGSKRQQRFLALSRAFHHMPPLSSPSDFMMDIDDLRALLSAGMTIGAHTATHKVLAGLPEDDAREELSRSKQELEQALVTPIVHFAYPNGHVASNVDDAAIRLTREAGYRSGGTSRRGAALVGTPTHNLPRQGINDALGFSGFVFKLEEARFSLLLRGS